MFRSIRLKITVLFVLLLLVTEAAVTGTGIISSLRQYHSGFEQTVKSVFDEQLRTELESIAEAGDMVISKPDASGTVVSEEIKGYENIQNTINSYLGALSIQSSRFYAVLDGSSGSVLCASSNAGEVKTSPTVVTALSGTEAMKTDISAKELEYALPVKAGDKVAYIVYIKDTCAMLNAETEGKLRAAALMGIISLAAAIVAGMLVSASVSVPIKKLTAQARKLADGDMSALPESDSKDELGRLANSLVHLAHSRNEITEKAIEEQIKVETILQNMKDGILAFNAKGRLIHFNPEAQRLLNRQYLDDVQFDRFFREIQADITLGDIIYMKQEGSVQREVHIEKLLLQLDFAPFSVDGKTGGIIVIIHDITRQEKLEKSRRDFVADVSHELRTPLTTIRSYAETLADMPDCDRELQVRFLNVIASEADRMARIIHDLLTLSELDSNISIYKNPEPINVRDMVSSIVERMSITAKKREQVLEYHPINEMPIIQGHPDSLERVITNIISNALKYTPTGGHIEVYTSKVYKDICIKVIDNGIGIPQDKLPHIFDRFYRVDKARSRDTGGTGLGLAIAKQTIESGFNGKIIINSELNKGTEVIITIPAE